MNVPEANYGWGILRLPVCRMGGAHSGTRDALPPVRLRCLADVVAGRELLFSGLATLLLGVSVLLYTPIPETAVQPNREPTEIPYRLRLEPVEIAPEPPPAPAAGSPRLDKSRATALPRQKRVAPVATATRPLPPPLTVTTQTPTETAVPVSTEPPSRPELPTAEKRSLRLEEREIALAPPTATQPRRQKPADTGFLRAPGRLTLESAQETTLPRKAVPGHTPRPAETLDLPARTSFPAVTVPPTGVDLQPAPAPAPRERSTAPAVPQRSAVLLAKESAREVAAPQKTAAPRPAEAKRTGPAAFAFLDRIAPAELDRSLLVSLNRLATCLDPEAELALKTRLAALLGRPDLCRSGGVVFEVLYPESAYSVHLDMYNYERRDFADRCAALRQAVACFEARR